MITSIRKIYPLYVFIDFIFIWISFFIPYYLKYNALSDIFQSVTLPNSDQYIFIFVLWAVFIMGFLHRKGLYATDRSLPIPKEIARVILNLFYVSVLMAAIIFFAQYKFFSREVFGENFLLLCLFLSGWRVIKRLIVRKLIAGGFHNINVLIVGAGKVGGVVLEEICQNPQWGFHVVGFLDDHKEEIDGFPVLGKVRDFPSVARKLFVDEIVVTIPSERELIGDIIKKAQTMHLGVRIVPENFEGPISFIEISYIGIIPLLTYKQRKHHPTEFVLKRFFDIILSAVLLTIFSPVFLIVAVLIRTDSPGPVFYVQQRVGLKGRRFRLFKFRSMMHNAEQMKSGLLGNNEVKDGVIFKMKKDPRVTKVGRVLRRFSLDELPQLYNVFKGDMSLVGPRPPTPDEVEQYNQQDLQRLSIRPGVTCISQVRGRSDLSFKRWVKWDLWYINNWSFGLDLRIILWTVPAVIRGRGAY
ncbi:MAG TPA: sugar transferase [Candidatus Omnitrophota bacterium]|jgi:exopolysaccharide biosynthesis polyprenyl glycosylphosphotransferase|nr:sugar transferase [Candidatus Omnitrophota bacterium]HPN57277.1 sugar transferase [Candidatus Omnitrophota bacterium]